MSAGFFDERLNEAVEPDKMRFSEILRFFSDAKHAGWERNVSFNCDRVHICSRDYTNAQVCLSAKYQYIDVQKYDESMMSLGFSKEDTLAFEFDSDNRVIKLGENVVLYFGASSKGLHDYNLAVISARYMYLTYDQKEKCQKYESTPFENSIKEDELCYDEAFHSELTSYMREHSSEDNAFEMGISGVEMLYYNLYDDIAKGTITVHMKIGTPGYYISRIRERHESISGREYVDRFSLNKQKRVCIDAEIEAAPYIEEYVEKNEMPRTIRFEFAEGGSYHGEQKNSVVLTTLHLGEHLLLCFKNSQDYNRFVEAVVTIRKNFKEALSEYEPIFSFKEHAHKSRLLEPMDKWTQKREREKARAESIEGLIAEGSFRHAVVCETSDFAVTAVDQEYGYVYIAYESLCVSYDALFDSCDFLLGRDINYLPLSYNREYGCIIGSCKEVVDKVCAAFPRFTYNDVKEGGAYKFVVTSVSKESADCKCGEVHAWFSCSSKEEARKLAPGDIVGCGLWNVIEQDDGRKSYHWTHMDVPEEALYLESVPQPKKTNSRQSSTDTKEILSNPMEELNGLIGLQSIKQDVTELLGMVKTMKLREERGLKAIPVSLHLVFTGNPGTGKTTVARILGQLYKEIGVLKKGQIVEVDRSDLVAGYVGQTAIKTQEKIAEARGGIIFIDEAYTLAKEGNDFGQEAIDTILKEMEDHRDDFVVIVAGYSDPMKKFIDSNPGLKSRFNKYFNFPDYSDNELIQIFDVMCEKYEYHITDDAKMLVVAKIEEMERNKGKNFANARDVRNYFERIVAKQSNRVSLMDNASNEALTTIVTEDVY